MRDITRRAWLIVAVVIFGLISGTPNAQEVGNAYLVKVDGLACPFCAYGIEKRFSAIENVASVEINIAEGTVTVSMHPGAILSRETARKAVAEAGFTMQDFAPKRGNQ